MAGLEGRTLNRYKLRRIIGRGGMADVYVAYDTHFDREVAVKVFKREDEDLLRRFVREAHLMASMSNPHLIPVYDSGTVGLDGVNMYYIVMPLMEGGTLRNLVRNSPISLQDACHYLSDIANALDYIHRQGIIHRDIKSSNVLLDAEGRCYLSDFGIARALTDSTQLTATGNVLGTVDYMAPELFDSDGKADVRSDFYSLGVLLYEMVTGALPFTAESQIAVVAMHVSKRPPLPRTLVPGISAQVERVLLKALEKRPDLRYQSATELAQAFCQATQMPAIDIAHVTNPVWGQLPAEPVPGAMAREAQVLAPAHYASSPATTAGGYAAFAPVPITPLRTPVRRREDSGVRTQTVIVTILALLALVAIIVPVSYVLYNQNTASNPTATIATSVPGATPNLTTTAQAISGAATARAGNTTATAQAGVTATAQAHAQATTQAKNATATAQANVTATAVAKVSATAGVVQTATAGNAEYQDTLLDKNNVATKAMNWDQNVNCTFKGDGYHATAPSGLFTVGGCGENAKQFQKFALKVDVSIVKGHSGGVFFHETPNINIVTGNSFAGYLFEIDTNGRYKVSSSNNFNQSNTPLQDWTTSPALKTGNVSNTLQIIAHAGGNFLFYINGVFIFSVQDTQYTNGNIGFLASSSDITQTTDVLYTNLSVYAA